jgi:hypothetical protein
LGNESFTAVAGTFTVASGVKLSELLCSEIAILRSGQKPDEVTLAGLICKTNDFGFSVLSQLQDFFHCRPNQQDPA